MPDIKTQFGLGSGGPIYGAPAPGYISNRYYHPHPYTGTTSNAATTATRLMYIPIFIYEAHTFIGVLTANAGSGDNGEKYRIGIYTWGTTGPDQLVGSFGEVTLTGASAQRLLTANVTIPAPGWYWLAIHSESASDLFLMRPAGFQISSVGPLAPFDMTNVVGLIAQDGNVPPTTITGACYVDTTYAALAQTAVAPTADSTSIVGISLRA